MIVDPRKTLVTSDHNRETFLVTQTIGGQSYSLKASSSASTTLPTPSSLALTVARITCGVVAFPFVFPFELMGALLMMVPPLRNPLLSITLPRFMKRVDKLYHEQRVALLKHVSGNVLDVGSGGGAYLPYCRADACELVVAVEPVSEMHAQIRKSGQHLEQHLMIVKDISELQHLHLQFDWVIFGNVLCEVPSVRTMIRQVDEMLKPGGHVYFSEHLGYPAGTWRRWVQDVCNPFWRHLSGGCNCNRDSLSILQRQTNWDTIVWIYNPFPLCIGPMEHYRLLIGPFAIGLAVKKEVMLAEVNHDVKKKEN